MHAEALMFAGRMLGGLSVTGHVLEIGARNINGSVRSLFTDAASYTGIDVLDGPGVDTVADGAVYVGQPAPCMVVCTEVLEHTPKGKELVENVAHLLAPGGWLLVTCATEPRAPHSAQDGGALVDGEYYGNVAPCDLRGWIDGAGLRVVHEEVHLDRGDLYALATKRMS